MMPFLTLGNVSIPTFFVVISLSLSFLMIYLYQRMNLLQGDRKLVFDIAILLMISGFIGGRAMHVMYEEWPYYQKYPIQILYFWQGGYVFFGGFILCILTGLFYCRIRKIDFLMMADFFAPLASLAHAFGRLGCFFAGCCYGSHCELPWSIENRHPTTLYLFGGELIIFFILIFFEKGLHSSNQQKLNGSVFVKWILLHCLLRLFVEYLRDDFRGAKFNWPIFGQLSVSQVVCIILIFFSFLFFLSKSRLKNTKLMA